MHFLRNSGIMTPMMNEPVFPPGYLESLRELCLPCLDRRHPRFEDQLLLPIGLAAFTGAIALHLAFYGGRRLLARIRRRVAPPETVPSAAPGEAVTLSADYTTHPARLEIRYKTTLPLLAPDGSDEL